MKNLFYSVALASATILATSCGNAPEGQKVETASASGEAAQASATANTLKVNAAASTINWVGAAVGKQHTGTIGLINGELSVENNNITAGKFDINIGSIVVTDLKPETGKDKLEGHLKAADFFDAAKYPAASFTITKVEAVTGDSTATHKISGDLKIKDKTNNITIPAKVTIAEGKVTAVTPKFTINRTQWGVNYNSTAITGIAKDKLISDDISLQLNIEAAK